MNRKGIRNGGFVYVELALALPCLALLTYGLALVGGKIFDLGKRQLADYVLEEEVHDVLSRLIYDARAARSVKFDKGRHKVEFTFGTVNEKINKDGSIYVGDVIADKTDRRIYLVHGGIGKQGSNINYKRQEKLEGHPITGDNYLGATRVTEFEISKSDKAENVLHVTLELMSEETEHKIKISTAVYMPCCESFKING